MDKNEQIRQEADPVIKELEEKGVSLNSTPDQMTGLGDMVEAALTKFGITQERFKAWATLEECSCTYRKRFLNNLLSWKKSP